MSMLADGTRTRESCRDEAMSGLGWEEGRVEEGQAEKDGDFVQGRRKVDGRESEEGRCLCVVGRRR